MSSSRRAFNSSTKPASLADHLAGWRVRDEMTLLHDSLPTYKPKTLICDLKVRRQYIEYLIYCVKELPESYHDDPGPYFNLLRQHGDVQDETPVEDMDLADVNPENHSSLPSVAPTSVSAEVHPENHSTPPTVAPTSVPETRTYRSITTTQYIYTYTEMPNGAQIPLDHPQMIAPQTTIQEINPSATESNSASSATPPPPRRSPLFTFERCMAYISCKIYNSKEKFEQTQQHCFSLDSMLDRFLPSLRRMFEYECLLAKEEFDDQQFKLMKQDLIEKLEHCGLPMKNS